MKKRMYRFLMTGVMAAAMLGMTACGSKTGTGDTAAAAAAADSSAAGETASGEDIGFPKKENIQYITGNAEVNPMKDFTLIACLQDNGFSTLAVPADAPYDNFAGFVEYAKAHPGELNAGMPAAGANTFLFGMLTSTTGIELNSVECASESDRLTNLAGGFIDIGVVGVGNAQEYEKAGKLKVIGTVSSDGTTISKYPEELPDNYKTLQEQGFDKCVMSIYHYLLGPAGMDETMVADMNAAMKAVCEDETVSAGIAGIGNIPGWHDLAESKEIHEREYAQFVEIAKELDMFVQE